MDKKNVLLVCGGGASSGFMAQNIRKAAKKRNIDIDVMARSESEIEDYINEIDVLLIGPHLKYMEADLRAKVEPYHIPAAVIDQSVYGLLDGNKGLDLILELLEK
ncbi:PTS sugar transporter subunit IIB [Bacillus chungangensis]|uniref:PTS system cellobiose-specific IIB component n=1 Tax=Bacillus chungangensis TaxID=587633 RepID=A0ABT9WR41_9BACI|nr:PTS sugar transporter subunit IIB [Bacillus chungangensis]MDQ0175245.1 PTS system cellobiose-specific IIB component [Bacillus chungangensis]